MDESTAENRGVSAASMRPDGRPRGRPFAPGNNRNPRGRPVGLARRTRQIVGNDCDQIVQFWLKVMNDERERTSDRLDASKLLAERGWGKPPSFQLVEDEDPLALQENLDLAVEEFDAEIRRLAKLHEERPSPNGWHAE